MRVVIAGGGIAALEALAGVRALAGERVEVTLLAPVGTFSYRPLSTAVPFTFHKERTRSLAELAGDLGARFVHQGLAQVDASRQRVLTHDGDFLPYDALLIAVGARVARPPSPGVMWSRGEGVAVLTPLLRELEEGTVRSVALVVPRDAAWPMDAYELGFVARLAAQRAGGETRVLLVTAEESPVDALGPAASEAIGDELARAGIELITGVEVRQPGHHDERGGDALTSVMPRFERGGHGPGEDHVVLHLEPGSPLVVDRALHLPAIHGPAVPGVAHDARGFLRVDGHARTEHDPRVYVAGDATALSLKHSTLSSSQAGAAAEAMAAAAGADVTPAPWSTVLYGMLTLPPHYPGARGSPWLADGGPVTHCVWWPPGHVAGRHLAPCLAARDPGVRPGLEWHPNGLPVAVPVGHDAASETHGQMVAPSEEDLRHDSLTRQLLAIRRAEREGERLSLDLERGLEDVERHEQEVVARLEAAGYLRHAG